MGDGLDGRRGRNAAAVALNAMDLKTLLDTPPWEWPRNAGKILHRILIDRQADESDRTDAAELAGDLIVVNDEIAESLLEIIGNPGEPERLRAAAAIAVGPALEQADTSGFEDPDEVPITERMFRRIKQSLRKFHSGDGFPKEVRRRVLEASVRAPEEWHRQAIEAAYSSGDAEWGLTAVFAMRRVRGFDDQILEALQSADEEIHREAVAAAGNWELAAAWIHIEALVADSATPKLLLLAAIEAAASIRPAAARNLLSDLADSEDEEIAEAAAEAIEMAEASEFVDEEDGDDLVRGKWIN